MIEIEHSICICHHQTAYMSRKMKFLWGKLVLTKILTIFYSFVYRICDFLDRRNLPKTFKTCFFGNTSCCQCRKIV